MKTAQGPAYQARSSLPLSPARGPPAPEAVFDQSPVFDPVAPASAPEFGV